jgi:hypothetical protein
LRSLIAVATILGSFTVSFGQEKKAVPGWVVFPGDDWETITPEEAGLDVQKWNAWVKRQKPS